jgi:hypothetical protein
MIGVGNAGSFPRWLQLYALLSLLWVGSWFGLKYMHFYALEYLGDLFSSLTASRSWLQGHPFLYDFRFGHSLRYHTFLLTALLGPVTLWLGAKGLFLVHAVLLWAVPLWLFSKIGQAADRRGLAVLLALYWGPFGAWLYDDIQLGWHPELLFFPLSLWFAGALLTKSRPAAIAAGTLLVLTREDGPVLACCLHLMALTTENRAFLGWSSGLVARRVLPVVAGWLGVFCLLMGVLIEQSLGHGVRIASAYHVFSRVSRLHQVHVLGKFGLETVLLLSPFGALIGWGYGRRMLLAWVVAGLPLLSVALVGSLLYPVQTWYGISWAPRMAMLMGYGLGALVLLRAGSPSLIFSAGRILRIIGLLVLGQWAALAVVRQYNGLWLDLQTARSLLADRPDSLRPQVWQLADEIPRRAWVAADYAFYAPFEHHRYLWVDHERLRYAPVRRPDFFITTAGSPVPEALRPILKNGYALHRRGALLVYRRSDFR